MSLFQDQNIAGIGATVSSSEIIITNCYFLNQGATAIYFDDDSHYAVISNVVNNTIGTGILLHSGKNCTVFNNTISYIGQVPGLQATYFEDAGYNGMALGDLTNSLIK